MTILVQADLSIRVWYNIDSALWINRTESWVSYWVLFRGTPPAHVSLHIRCRMVSASIVASHRCVLRRWHGINLMCRQNEPNSLRVGYPWPVVREPRGNSFRSPCCSIPLSGGGGSVVFHPAAVPVLGVPYPFLGCCIVSAMRRWSSTKRAMQSSSMVSHDSRLCPCAEFSAACRTSLIIERPNWIMSIACWCVGGLLVVLFGGWAGDDSTGWCSLCPASVI